MTTAKPLGGQGGRDAKNVVTRFAPSPTGRLHLGHAWSALLAHDYARARGGAFLLRIEDIDPGRSREEHVAGIIEDLSWLGLSWDGDIVRQSQRLPLYSEALDRLKAQDLIYPCFCTRAAIAHEIAASASAPHPGSESRTGGPDGPLYPGTCRALSANERTTRMANEPHAWRLDVAKAILPGTGRGTAAGGGGAGTSARGTAAGGGGAGTSAGALTWTNHGQEIPAQLHLFGDVILARKDAPTSYHLAVTLDDAAQGVTDVVRGMDLYPSTHIHRLLQSLLGLPTPNYHHHALLADADGQRLAKRGAAPSLADLRAAGADPAQLAENLRHGILPAEIRMQNA